MPYLTDIERLNYYEGQYLGALDFQAEQDYDRDMRRRHNVGPHTWGIISGLDLAQVLNSQTVSGPLQVPAVSGCPITTQASGGQSSSSPTPVDIYVQPGVAVDGFGREIVVLNPTQLTQELFAAFYNPAGTPMLMQVWIAYQQRLAIGASDACVAQNTTNAFGRVVESFQLQVTPSGTAPADDKIMVSGTPMTPPMPPPSTTSSQSSAPTDGEIVLPADGSVPYQEFPEDDTTVTWWILLGQVLWNSQSGTFYQIPAASVACNRLYVGSVCSTIYAPSGRLLVTDGSSPYSPSGQPSDPNLGGAAVEVAGSLTVEFLLNATQNVLIGGTYNSPAKPALLPPLTIMPASSDSDETLIQFRDPSGTPKWQICENRNGNAPGVDFMEYVATQGSSTPTLVDRFFLQSGGNVGIGTTSPQQNLSIQGGLNVDQNNQNAKGPTSGQPSFGLTFGTNAGTGGGTSGEGIASNRAGGPNQWGLDFYTNYASRMSITQAGNVGIGTTTPQQNLSIQGGLNVDQNNQNANGPTSGQPSFGLTFGTNAGTGGGTSGEGIASNRAGGSNQWGLDFYTDYASRMSITQAGNVGIGPSSPTQTWQAKLSVQGGLSIDQGNQNSNSSPPTTGSISLGLTFGTHVAADGTSDGTSGECIASNRQTGANKYGLDFYTAYNARMSITNSGNVGIGTSNPVFSLDVAGSARISGNLTVGTVNGTKIGYVADRFINRQGVKFEQGDVVVLHPSPAAPACGSNARVPLVEVELSNQPRDTRVCGIVDEPALPAALMGDLDPASLGSPTLGLMVTLGAYAFCKVDADIAPIMAGDLLTTSPTPGYAQNVKPGARPQAGAIIGKALVSLAAGKGKIPVLVSHQ